MLVNTVHQRCQISEAHLMIASRANTVEQHPPKISTTMLRGPRAGIMMLSSLRELKVNE